MSVPEVQIGLDLNEFVDLLIRKIKGVFGIGDNEFSVKKTDENIYQVEFEKPVITTDRTINEFERSLLYWGFLLTNEKTGMYTETGDNQSLSIIQEYTNNDRVRVILVYRYKLGTKGNGHYIDRIIIGRTALINNILSENVEEVIDVLEELEINYRHRVDYWSQIIEIDGVIMGLRLNHGFQVVYSNCKTVDIRMRLDGKTAMLTVRDWCEEKLKEESVDLPEDVDIEYSGRTLYLKFRYRYYR
jgi:hypothetical protein